MFDLVTVSTAASGVETAVFAKSGRTRRRARRSRRIAARAVQ